MGTTPGVTLMCDFVQAANAGSSFGGFLDYMNRPDAFEAPELNAGQGSGALYSGYMDYMRNDDKSDGLFTAINDHADPARVEELKNEFTRRQNLGCPLYRGIISFDNAFLKEIGLIDQAGPDRTIIKETARASILELIEKSHLDPARVLWTGAIHTNTDNVHVHYSIIEDQKYTRRKDMIALTAIDASKSVIVNKLVGSEETILRTRLVREKLLPGVRHEAKNNTALLSDLMDFLPNNIPWEYGRKNFGPYRGRVDQVTNTIIMNNPALKEPWDLINKDLDQYEKDVRRFYGDGDRRLWENVKANRLSDFYMRAGNTLLKELQREVPVSIRGSLLPGIDARAETYSAIMDVAARTPHVDIVPLFESGLTTAQETDALWLLDMAPKDIITHVLYPGCEDQKIIECLVNKMKSNPNAAGLSDKIIQQTLRNNLRAETGTTPAQGQTDRPAVAGSAPRYASCRTVRASMNEEQQPHHGRQLYISCMSAMRRLDREYARHIQELEREYEQAQCPGKSYG